MELKPFLSKLQLVYSVKKTYAKMVLPAPAVPYLARYQQVVCAGWTYESPDTTASFPVSQPIA